MKCFWARNCRWWGPAKRTKNDSNLYDNFIIKQLNYLVNPAVSCSDTVFDPSYISSLLFREMSKIGKMNLPLNADFICERLVQCGSPKRTCNSPLCQLTKYNNFLWGYYFLAKSLSNFVSLSWKLDNPHYHIEDDQFSLLLYSKLCIKYGSVFPSLIPIFLPFYT